MIVGQDVTVLGAGVAGLTVALALALRGAKVTILEQADSIREVGAGLQITPNGIAVLRALGIEPMAHAVRSDGVELRDGATGNFVAALDLKSLRPDQDWALMHRSDLIDLLGQAVRAAGVELRFLQKVDRLELRPEGPVLISAQGAEIHSALVVGADGVHSVTRAALNPESQAFFTNQVAWRAVIPEPNGARSVAEIHMGPGRHLVSYPLRGGQWRNIVAIEERKSWAEESWSMPEDPKELRFAFKDFAPRVTDWLDRVDDCWLWGLFRHPVARHWSWLAPATPAQGVVLLGDAAHPTLPFLAQGANMAIEDAWVLAEALAQNVPLAQAFAAYHSARMGRVSRVIEAANGNARNYHLRSPLREVAHLGLKTVSQYAPNMLLRRYDWIYAYDVTGGARLA